ncbi:Uncharacterised protein [Yersinia frederiksenii]|nr:Uncharacterised protein [Yersinia frederiksenii]CNI83608.1 Uncharacterised protein [Yersinia frederiksenii]
MPRNNNGRRYITARFFIDQNQGMQVLRRDGFAINRDVLYLTEVPWRIAA